jgi:hypothetical protein
MANVRFLLRAAAGGETRPDPDQRKLRQSYLAFVITKDI